MNVLLPQDLARELIDEGLAKASRKPRGPVLEWVISDAANVAVWVTLLQTPAVFDFYARWLKQHASKHHGRVSVRVSGPRGVLKLFDVRQDEDVADVVRQVRGLLEE